MSTERKHGFQHGVKWAIQWLHEEAERMNDPRARGVLNDAAYHLGVAKKGVEPAPTESARSAGEEPSSSDADGDKL